MTLTLKRLKLKPGGNSVDGANEPQPSDQPDVVESESPQRQEFEKRLLDEKPNTFKTYVQLPEEEKVKVIKEYLSSGKDVEQANRLIFDLYYK